MGGNGSAAIKEKTMSRNRCIRSDNGSEEYQESFAQLSRSFCMTPQMTPVTDRGELLFQRRLAENRIAAAGQIREMGSILEGAMERIYGTKEDVPLEQEIGKRLRFMGITLIQVFFYSPGGRKRQV